MNRASWYKLMNKQNLYYLFCGLAFVGILFLHIYKIDSVPLGLHIDEVGMAYDAWCFWDNGTDRWLDSYPIYLRNTGNGQSVLYCALCALCFKFFGISIFTIRLPAIVFSMLTLVFGVKLVKLCWKGDRLRCVLAIVLFGLVPYFTQNGRYGLDCNLMLGTFTIFLYYFVKAIIENKYRYYFISGIACGVVLYSYIISYVTLPVFLLCALIYLAIIRKIDIKGMVLFGIPLGILAFPLIMTQLINIFQWDDMEIGIFTMNKLPNYRTSEFTVNNIFSNLIQTIKCLIRDGELIFDAFPQYGTFYWLSLPFIGIGGIAAVIKAIKSLINREFELYFLMICWIGCMVILGCFLGGDGPLTYRFNGAFFVLLLIIVEGIIQIVRVAGKYRYVFLGILIGGYCIFFASFFRYYFFIYPEDVYPQYGFLPDLFEVVEYNEKNSEELGDYQIYLCLNHATAEYYGIAAKVSPEEYYVDGERDAGRCRNVIFITDEEELIDKNGCYIVWEVYTDMLERLERLGFSEKRVGHYVYMTPGNDK